MYMPKNNACFFHIIKPTVWEFVRFITFKGAGKGINKSKS